jgi:hypothetical protein
MIFADDEGYYEHDYYKEYLSVNIDDAKECLQNKSDIELLDIAISKGKELNIEHFPAYDVALELKTNGWKPTPKQRAAIENVTAFYIGAKE